MAKWMWMIAGPNGAGKSTFAARFLTDLGHPRLIRLNADDYTLELRRAFPDADQSDLNLRAAVAVDEHVAQCIDAGQNFVVETVMSSGKYRDDVIAAKARGFRFGLIYISLHPPELSPLRVSERAAKGGHDVEAAKAVQRYHRSHDELRWFAPQADLLMVFDNSSPDAAPVLLASRTSTTPLKHIARGINPAVDRALADMSPPSADGEAGLTSRP